MDQLLFHARMTPSQPIASDERPRTRVSAVLLCYNHAHTIGRSIGSILNQTEPFDQILISDDCSTDNSVEVISKYVRIDSRVRLLQPPHNLGMSGNANYAVSHVDTEYFAILHHDDVYMTAANKEWKNVLDRHADVGYVYNAHYNADGRPPFKDPHRELRIDGNDFLSKYLMPRWSSPVWGSAFIRKTAWDTVGGMKTEYGSIADVYLWMDLASRFAVGYVPEPLFQILHDRPDSYPEEYLQFTWRRHANLIRIHGDFRRQMLEQSRLSQMAFFWFRIRATGLTLKWLVYAVYKKKWAMLKSFKTYDAKYELSWVRLLPSLIEGLGF